ncbi:MAG: hypothetical protein OHK0015_38510 [Chloroflexi bacterium OHK40]
MAEPCHELWRATLGAEARALAIAADGELIVVGAEDGGVAGLDHAGKLRWRAEVGGAIRGLALAEPARRLLVGGAAPTGGRLLDFDGRALATLEDCGPVVALTADARFLIGASRPDRRQERLRGYGPDGTQRWDQDAGGLIASLAIAPDGQWLACGNDRGVVELRTLEGQRVAFYRTRSSTTPLVAFMPEGDGLIVADDRMLHGVAFDGKPRWTIDLPARASALAVASAGREVAVGCADGSIMLVDSSGIVRWQHRVRAGRRITGVALSASGRFLAASAFGYGVMILDSEYAQLWQGLHTAEPTRIALTPDARLLAVTTLDGAVTLIANPAAQTGAAAGAWRERRLIRQLRRQFLANPFLCIATWFDEFDRALRRNELAICDALLSEVRGEAYGLDQEALALVASREAALRLRQGVGHHEHGQHDAARQAYTRSLELHRTVGHREGEGQAMAALAALDEPEGVAVPLLASLRAHPLVLGSSDNLLAGWLPGRALAEQLQIISAAAQLGMAQPLLRAIELPESSVQTAAAAALALLDPGPDRATLAAMLESPNWFVRWQAVTILGQQSGRQGPGSQPEGLASTIAALLARQEEESIVRRELARLLGATQDPAYTGPLLALADDPDDEVRLAAVESLAVAGGREALPALVELTDGSTLSGRNPRSVAAEAARAIGRRHPIPRVQDLWLRRASVPESAETGAQTLFLGSDGPLEAVVTLSHASTGVRVGWRCLYEGQPLAEQQLLTRHDAYRHVPRPREALVELAEEPGPAPEHGAAGGSIEAGLVQLLDGPEARGRLEQPRQLCLPLDPPGGVWASGTYVVEVSVEGQEPGRCSFRVASSVAIESVQAAVRVAGATQRDAIAAILPAHTTGFTAIIKLNDAPRGTAIRGQLQHPEQERLIAESQAQTVGEGRQELRLRFTTEALPVGRYRLVVGGGGAVAGTWLTVTDRVAIVRIAASVNGGRPGSTYQQGNELVCTIETGPLPPGVAFQASWWADGRQLGEACEFRSSAGGPHEITFTLRADDRPWPAGVYEVALSGYGGASAQASVTVRPGLRDRVTQFFSRTLPISDAGFAPARLTASATGSVIGRPTPPASLPVDGAVWYAGATAPLAVPVQPEPPRALPVAPEQDVPVRSGADQVMTPGVSAPAPARTTVPSDLIAGLAEQYRTGATPRPASSPPVRPPSQEADLIAGLRALLDAQRPPASRHIAPAPEEQQEEPTTSTDT